MSRKTTIKPRSYSVAMTKETFAERYEYLSLVGVVGVSTFGGSRHLNQSLYSSKRWKDAREEVIIRDNGCDLGMPGHEIHDRVIVHHIVPITPEDILLDRDWVYDPEYLICTSQETHNAIHYGDASFNKPKLIERQPGDTCPWK